MAGSRKNGIYAFDNFSLDVDKLMLYRDGEEILIAAKVVKTLAVLVENAGTIIGKDELIDRVWGDSIVEESNLTQYLYLLRKALGAMPDGRPYIETLRRRGYRFNGEVTEVRIGPVRQPPVQAEPEPGVNFSGVERDGNVLRVVDWQPGRAGIAAQPDAARAKTESVPVSRKISWMRFAAAALAFAMLAGGGLFFFWPRSMPGATSAESRRELSVVRLTNGALPNGATISHDGNYFTYNEADGEMMRVFVQQVGQPSRLEIASSKDDVFYVNTFSPDARSIYYATANKFDGVWSLRRVPTMGGPSVKILDDISGPVSFSPDGKEIVFRRFAGKSGELTSLVIADKDGRTQRVILQRQSPKGITGSPTWSPDGTTIVFGEMDTPDPKTKPYGRLRALKVSTGEVSVLSDEKWDTMFRASWVPDGKGLVMIGTRGNEAYTPRRDQVYYISYPDGVSHRITSEGNRHEVDSLGVAANGSIVAVPANRSSQIWAIGADGDAKNAVQLTKGAADGRAGLSPLSDGRVGYLARNAEELNILVMKPDGSDAKPLATGFPVVEELRADPQGRFFVFSSVKDFRSHLFRIDTDGENLKQLTFGDGSEIDSTISPDGKFIVSDRTSHYDEVPQSSLIKIPSDGGDPIKLEVTGCVAPTFSPDGSLLSCVRFDRNEIVVVAAADGKEIQTYRLPSEATANFGVGWTPDGSGLIYMISDRYSSNLWVQPRDGGKARQLTNFSGGVIYRYSYSPDGTKLYVARGFPIQDAVLISNYR